MQGMSCTFQLHLHKANMKLLAKRYLGCAEVEKLIMNGNSNAEHDFFFNVYSSFLGGGKTLSQI